MFRRFASLALAVAALAGCNDIYKNLAGTAVVPDTLVAYALSGTPSSYPSALNTVARTVVRADATADFDVGFDIDGTGKVVVYPARLLVSSLAGAHTVGLMTSPLVYDSLTRAPDGYYRPDTAVTISVGQSLLILSNRSAVTDICLYFATPKVYAKLVVDSVNLVTRAIYLRHTVDPNCGFRSFLLGFPVN